MENENYIKCSNCESDIPSSKMMLHEPFCIRNVKKCKCGMMINIEDEEEHNSEYHTDVKCTHCKKGYPKTEILQHLQNCLERITECKYCTLQISYREKEDHEYLCGAKSEKCDRCNKFIPIKDYDTHHCDEEIYLNKHIDISNIPIVNKKKKPINTGDIAINRPDTSNKKDIVKKSTVPSILEPPIIHHKREVLVKKGPSVKVEVKRDPIAKEVKPSEKINHKIDINNQKTHENIPKKTSNITYANVDIVDKSKKEKVIKHPVPLSEVKSNSNKINDILMSGLKGKKENIIFENKPITKTKPINETTTKKSIQSNDIFTKDHTFSKIPIKKEPIKDTNKAKPIPSTNIRNPTNIKEKIPDKQAKPTNIDLNDYLITDDHIDDLNHIRDQNDLEDEILKKVIAESLRK